MSGRAVDCGFAFEPSGTFDARSFLGVGPGASLVGFTVRQWLAPKAQARYERAVAALADHVIESYGAHVVFVAQVTSQHHADDDRIVSARVADRMRLPAHVIHDRLDHRTLKSLYTTLDLLVGTRFHSVIFALNMGVPALAIEYEHKTTGVMTDLGLGAWVIDIEAVTPEGLIATFDCLVAHRAAYLTPTWPPRLSPADAGPRRGTICGRWWKPGGNDSDRAVRHGPPPTGGRRARAVCGVDWWRPGPQPRSVGASPARPWFSTRGGGSTDRLPAALAAPGSRRPIRPGLAGQGSRRVIAEEQPAVVNVYAPAPGIADTLAIVVGGIPLVVTWHTGHDAQTAPPRRPNRRCLRAHDVPTHAAARRLGGIDVRLHAQPVLAVGGKCTTITPGIDTAVFTPRVTATLPGCCSLAGWRVLTGTRGWPRCWTPCRPSPRPAPACGSRSSDPARSSQSSPARRRARARR